MVRSHEKREENLDVLKVKKEGKGGSLRETDRWMVHYARGQDLKLS